MTTTIPSPLFVFELANNHMGDVAHGLRVIREIAAVTRDFPGFHFGFKFQYRDLDTFIRPDFRGRDDVKYVKRFAETRLDDAQFGQLLAAVRAEGCFAICTPFDEPSVARIAAQGFDFIKVASCSFGDWPLWEAIARQPHPVIASTAAASLEQIDRVVSFLQHRDRHFALLHCVAEYPTPDAALQLNQIDVLRARYPGQLVGYSTHEDPAATTSIGLALAKGARVFEKHVGVATAAWPLNAYSASPEQVAAWLAAARRALDACGVEGRHQSNAAEIASLHSLRRGLFARRPIVAGEVLARDATYLAFPPDPGQYTADHCSKYSIFRATAAIPADAPITPENTTLQDTRAQINAIALDVRDLLARSHVIAPVSAELEISHHYGLDRFREFGLVMLTVVNREYCKKLLILLAGQAHPEQYHRRKEETFHVLYGEARIRLDDEWRTVRPGDVVTVPPGVRHYFETASGTVFEELSSTHYVDDSFYTDPEIMANTQRKSYLKYWLR